DHDGRAVARSVSAELHSGFQALRAHMPMNIRSSFPNRGVTPEVQADINRITAVWRDCRKRFGEGKGDFLVGHFSIAVATHRATVAGVHGRTLRSSSRLRRRQWRLTSALR